MKALPKEPSAWDALRGAAIFDLAYESDDGHGSGAIGGFFWGPHIGWTAKEFFVVIPDAAEAAKEHLAAHPNHHITNGADKWILPEGLLRITKAEMELAYAQDRVRQEREAAAA